MTETRMGANGFDPCAAKVDIELDCLGLTCPEPMMATAKRVREMRTGQVLLLLTDDPATLDDIEAWCRLSGHERLGVVSRGEQHRIWVRKLDRGGRSARAGAIP